MIVRAMSVWQIQCPYTYVEKIIVAVQTSQ